MESDRVKRGGVVLIILGFVTAAPGFWLLIAADHYLATARVQINPNPDLRFYAPRSIQNKLEVLQSPSVLTNVVAELRLDPEWRKRCADGGKSDMAEATDRLKRSIRLIPIPNTTLVDISVACEEFLESENTANAVADAFCDWRPWQSQGVIVKVLEEELQTVEQNMRIAQAEVDRLKAEPNPPAVLPERSDSKWQPYHDAEEKLERLKDVRRILEMRLSTTWLPASPIALVRHAIPETTPTYPNRALGVVLLDLGAILVSCGGFLVARNWSATGSCP